MALLLLAACASPVTVIDRDSAGRICRIEQPEDSRVEIPGEITVELRGHPEQPGILQQVLGVMVLREAE